MFLGVPWVGIMSKVNLRDLKLTKLKYAKKLRYANSKLNEFHLKIKS